MSLTTRLIQGLDSSFAEKEGAHREIASRIGIERFYPGEDDLFLAFPQQDRAGLITRIKEAIISVAKGVGFSEMEDFSPESSGPISLAIPDKQKRTILSIESRDEGSKILVLIRTFHFSFPW